MTKRTWLQEATDVFKLQGPVIFSNNSQDPTDYGMKNIGPLQQFEQFFKLFESISWADTRFFKKKKSTNKQTTNQPTKKKHTQLFYQIRHTTWLSILFGITLIMNEIHYASNTQCNSSPTNFIRKWIVRKKNCKPTLGIKRAKTVGKFFFILLWIVLLLVRWDFSNRKWILRPGRHRDGRT